MVMDVENRRDWVADEPCLMLFDEANGVWQFHQQNRLFFMKLEELEQAHICSSGYGWLLVYGKNRFLFFVDPFNRRTIKLPEIVGHTYTSLHFFNPPTSPDCFVVGIAGNPLSGAVDVDIFRRGMGGWDYHEYQLEIPFNETMSPPVLRRGLLYFVGIDGSVATLDVQFSNWSVHTTTGLPLLEIKQHFLFEIKGDEALYAVFLVGDAEMVSVFRLREPEMEWESVEGLGENTVYLSQGSCFGHATAESSTDLANKIHFPIFRHRSLLSYSLDDRRYHSLEGDYSHDNTCYGLRRVDVAATWILPTNMSVTDWTVDWSIERNEEEGENVEEEDEEEEGSASTVLSGISVISFLLRRRRHCALMDTAYK